MSNATDDTGLPGTRNKGQGLVAAFRAARLSQRPSLRNDLRTNREALRQERLGRLGRPEAAPQAAMPETVVEENHDVEKTAPPPALAAAASVFASFIDSAATPSPEPVVAASETTGQPEAATEQAALGAAPSAVAAEPTREAPHTPAISLSAIGFGPGMMIRLSQLGIETAADLAGADATSLRSALGDISRLINVDLWIASARDACAKAA